MRPTIHTDGSTHYILDSVLEKKAEMQDASVVIPLLWIVRCASRAVVRQCSHDRRMGHCNVNSEEKIAGLQELLEKKTVRKAHSDSNLRCSSACRRLRQPFRSCQL